MSDKEKCWACGKTLTGGEKLGLCEGCLNKYGTNTAIVALGLGIAGKLVKLVRSEWRTNDE